LRAADADLRRGRLHVLPLHADLRRLGRHPGSAGRPPLARRRDRHAAAEVLPRARLPRRGLRDLSRRRHVALRPGPRGDPRERGPRAVPRLQRPALQDGGEDRARFLGYNVQRYKMAACMISALLTGTAGAIYPIRSAFATPDLMLWTESGEFIISVMIGGLGTLAGPILGGAFFTILRDKVSSFVDWYFIVIG